MRTYRSKSHGGGVTRPLHFWRDTMEHRRTDETSVQRSATHQRLISTEWSVDLTCNDEGAVCVAAHRFDDDTNSSVRVKDTTPVPGRSLDLGNQWSGSQRVYDNSYDAGCLPLTWPWINTSPHFVKTRRTKMPAKGAPPIGMTTTRDGERVQVSKGDENAAPIALSDHARIVPPQSN